MPTPDADVVVLGAGPAGSIAARACAQAGVSVLWIAPEAPADTHHQIESFPASGAPLADEISLLEPICGLSYGPADQLDLTWRETPEQRVFDGDGPLLLPRAALHASLEAACASFQNVHRIRAQAKQIQTSRSDATITADGRTYTASVLIDARGRHVGRRVSSDLVALPFSGTVRTAGRRMLLEAHRSAWVWACHVPDGAIHGAVFQRAGELAGLSAFDRAGYLSHILQPHSVHDLRAHTPVAAGLSFVTQAVPSPRHLIIGDAALARDPIASHGLVHAMRSAVQTAIAAQTILDPTCDSEAAISFLRLKHDDAVAGAQAATAQAYADQSLFDTEFWATETVKKPSAPSQLLLDGPLDLAQPLTRAPVLEQDRIRWRPAISRPAVQDFAVSLGTISPLDIATACRPPAPLPEIAARLGCVHDGKAVVQALDHLIDGGAFVQTS